ncbi:lasso peptide biosynthesis B2 protein [Alkalihalobacterium chitinilyticum]|uniref:Lasso peptide biosynthesis B2 protein n=1 Tax=Alkalihalobacterium chitinilyticum TaxID=2980103 RepID=A0ABT5VEC6_9BACI|nr:lasso peptide biosynthesis B2 protein [Alkalihalobacterium chitinilyticum]MDE5413813.1 lasso peptide biosynthesis B2 protein [Alkalihalobacterium chitinilyticum]
MMLQKIKAFVKLDVKTKLMFLEAFLFLGWGRIMKLLPFSKIAPTLGLPMEETNRDYNEQEKRVLASVSQSIHIMSKYTLWESQCLVKAIAGMKMLERRGIESTIYLGTAKDERGLLIAHAWLRSGPFYISGAEEMERFTVVSKFAKRISARQIKGEHYG